MNPAEELRSLVIGEVAYPTRYTKKFLNRRPYVAPDPRRVTCVIPGVIRKVRVREGSRVTEGEKILVLEAMKMQNDVVAHHDARVRWICVREGDVVAKGQTLMEFE
jgi:biotin carboxyl carrier protein